MRSHLLGNNKGLEDILTIFIYFIFSQLTGTQW